MYAIAIFVSQVFELGVRLPIETVLRRGQMAIVTSRPTSSRSNATFLHSNSQDSIQTSVELAPYTGLISTMYHIVFDEGSRGATAPELVEATGGAVAVTVGSLGKGEKRRKGQGVEGLFRGWRVGMWGLMGVWGAATLGGAGGKGGEF